MPKPLIDRNGDVRPLTRADFRKMRPARDAVPEVVERHKGTRGPQNAPTKVSTTIRLDPAVVAFFKSKGRGWQSRINEVLKAVVESAK